MKSNGYRASHRNKWFLLTKDILTLREFMLFEYYIDNIIFGKKYPNKYGQFESFTQEIALKFHVTEKSVRDWHTGLIGKGFIQLVDPLRHLYTLKNPTRHIVGLAQWGGEASKYAELETDQSVDFILENIKFLPSIGKNIPTLSHSPILSDTNSSQNSLSSSKDPMFSMGNRNAVVIKQVVRSKEEYRQIYKEGSYIGLTPDDMEWIDINQTFTN